MHHAVFCGIVAAGALIVSPALAVDVWIGTRTDPGDPSRGVYHLWLDDRTGEPGEARLVAEMDQPGFVARHPKLPVLYVVGDVAGEPSVAAFAIEGDPRERSLRRLNSQPIGDGGGAHVAVDATGKALFTAQYGGGSAASFPLAEDGSLGERASLIEHRGGSGVVASRQEGPHPHWVGASPDNRFVLVPDLGADKVFLHRLDASTAELTEHGAGAAIAGGGPRHFAFHPNGRWGYLVNELAMSLSLFDYNGDRGTLTLRQTAPTLTSGQRDGERHNSGSEVRVHPSGKFVYSANRGHDSITAFRVDRRSGELSLIEQEPIRGSWPRNFNLTPDGRWLLAAGRDSNTLSVFEVDQETGALQYTLKTAYAPSPICVAVD